MKRLILTFAASVAALAATSAPTVSGVTMTQPDEQRLVTISYTLADASAIITLDVQTNKTGAATDVAGDWVSVGGEALWSVSGDVWKKIDAGARKICWKPGRFWRGQSASAARAVVTAWPTDNPPNYLVADLTEGAAANSERYYPAVEFLPGGLLANKDYRTTRLVMRKISAKGVKWQMGSESSETGYQSKSEKLHTVTMGSSYYIGVFEITQSQYLLAQTNGIAATNGFYFGTDCAMRPAENVSYNEIRNSSKSTTAVAKYNWPNDPNPDSFLGMLRTKTGLKFDLPSDAQWEFACRAGIGSGYWNDGSAIVGENSDANVERLGRTRYNGGFAGSAEPAATVGPTNGTAIVGSYAPNAWGLYDMHGNVWEFCLDWYADDVSSLTDDKPNINPDDASKLRTNTATAGTDRVRRGGSWGHEAYRARSAYRLNRTPKDPTRFVGFRVALPIGE
jgi:formylglycine-generating enzyme required for sulfatase activity